MPGAVAEGKVRQLFPVALYRNSTTSVWRLPGDRRLYVTEDVVDVPPLGQPCGIEGRGVVRAALIRQWAECLPVPTNVVTSGEALPEWTTPLQSRGVVVRRVDLQPVMWLVSSHLVGPCWTEYAQSGTVGGKKMPEGMAQYQPLPGLAVIPTVADTTHGYDVAVSHDVAAELCAEFDEALTLCTDAYTAAAAYAEARGVTLLSAVLAVGELDGQLVLCAEFFTPEVACMVPAERIDPARPSAEEEATLRRWAGLMKPDDGEQWPPLDGWVVRAVRDNLRIICERLTGSCPI